MRGVRQHQLEIPIIQDVPHRLPVDAGRLHRHMGAIVCRQPRSCDIVLSVVTVVIALGQSREAALSSFPSTWPLSIWVTAASLRSRRTRCAPSSNASCCITGSIAVTLWGGFPPCAMRGAPLSPDSRGDRARADAGGGEGMAARREADRRGIQHQKQSHRSLTRLPRGPELGHGASICIAGITCLQR
jgi:hypothetical protein